MVRINRNLIFFFPFLPYFAYFQFEKELNGGFGDFESLCSNGQLNLGRNVAAL